MRVCGPEGRWLVRKTHPHIHKLLFPAYIVIGRKNWLFHGNDKGARAGATLYSLIETCKAHQIDIFAWLKHALTYMHQADTLEKMEALLPFNVKPEDLEAARAIPELIYPEKSVAN